MNYPNEWEFINPKSQMKCTVYYIENNIPHIFETTFEKFVDLKVPALALQLPNLKEIKRIQRREFVRIQTNVDIALYFQNSKMKPLITVTQDISGGGARVVIPSSLPMKHHRQALDLYFILNSNQFGFEYVHTKAEIVRTHFEYGVHSLSLKFLLLNEQERQKIISYCFDIQRENRKQGFI